MNYLEMIRKICNEVSTCHKCPFYYHHRCIGRKVPMEWHNEEILQIDTFLTNSVLEEAKKYD